jgi:hypothetical protein
VYIGVARSGQFAVQRKGGASGEQHYRQPVPKQVLDRHAGIGGPGIDMHEHCLSLAGRQGIAAGHVNGDDLVRAEDHFRMLAAFAVPARDLLDQRDMIGAEIGKDIVNAEVDEPFEEIMRGTVAAHSLFLVFPCRPSACFLFGDEAGVVCQGWPPTTRRMMPSASVTSPSESQATN